MIIYWYRDENNELKSKTEKQIMTEGVIYVGIGILIALLTIIIFK